eukprot:2879330-Pyramimonas_sp.AAC.1
MSGAGRDRLLTAVPAAAAARLPAAAAAGSLLASQLKPCLLTTGSTSSPRPSRALGASWQLRVTMPL